MLKNKGEWLFVLAIATTILAYQWQILGCSYSFYYKILSLAWLFVAISFTIIAQERNKFPAVLFGDFCISIAIGNVVNELLFDPTTYNISSVWFAGIGLLWVIYKIIRHK